MDIWSSGRCLGHIGLYGTCWRLKRPDDTLLRRRGRNWDTIGRRVVVAAGTTSALELIRIRRLIGRFGSLPEIGLALAFVKEYATDARTNEDNHNDQDNYARRDATRRSFSCIFLFSLTFAGVFFSFCYRYTLHSLQDGITRLRQGIINHFGIKDVEGSSLHQPGRWLNKVVVVTEDAATRELISDGRGTGTFLFNLANKCNVKKHSCI
mmetsp:Transcript_37658/g.82490  ORF Transcript_37658/g.82490 Transcript_37658/m.82490 type:complete len:209 (-) Transcript_37658:1738-2364(-)